MAPGPRRFFFSYRKANFIACITAHESRSQNLYSGLVGARNSVSASLRAKSVVDDHAFPGVVHRRPRFQQYDIDLAQVSPDALSCRNGRTTARPIPVALSSGTPCATPPPSRTACSPAFNQPLGIPAAISQPDGAAPSLAKMDLELMAGLANTVQWHQKVVCLTKPRRDHEGGPCQQFRRRASTPSLGAAVQLT